MRIKLLACEVFAREISLVSATSPHVIDLVLMPFGLHDTPEKLREALQQEIDAIGPGGPEAVALSYGLCSRGTAGLRAGSVPLVVPRAHDCIAILLGSRARYDEEFQGHPGTYYYSPGWIERKTGEVRQGIIDDKYASRADARYQDYVEKYGEDNAKFLMEQESQWLQHYTRAALIEIGIGNVAGYRRFTRELAAGRGWDYVEIEGDLSILHRLAHADWDSEDFLIVPPGQCIRESFDDQVVIAGE